MGHFLPYALVLVCPISMGLMMRRQGDGGEKAALQRRVEELEKASRPAPPSGVAGPRSPSKEDRAEPEAQRVQA
jgi:hypothetical protein